MGKIQTVIERINVDFPFAEVIRAEIFRVGVIDLRERHANGDFLPRVAVSLRCALENAKRIIPTPRVHVGAADAVHQRRVKLVLELGGRHKRSHLAVHVHLSGRWHSPLVLWRRLVANHVENLGVVEFGERSKLLLRRHHWSSCHVFSFLDH